MNEGRPGGRSKAMSYKRYPFGAAWMPTWSAGQVISSMADGSTVESDADPRIVVSEHDGNTRIDIAPDAGTDHDVPALAELVRVASGWWWEAGARPGSRVAILKDDHWDIDLLACAAVRAGAVPAKLSGRLPAETASASLPGSSTIATWL